MPLKVLRSAGVERIERTEPFSPDFHPGFFIFFELLSAALRGPQIFLEASELWDRIVARTPSKKPK
jgi:hypothetical protein